MNAKRNPVLTIGHSNHEPDAFAALLRQHGVDVVVDVRSAPYSRYLPHFNKETLQALLAQAGIGYVFKGQELGGQPAERECYDADGRIRYDRLAATDAFAKGIAYVLDAAAVHPSTGSGRTAAGPRTGSERAPYSLEGRTAASSVQRPALLCSEKEPLECHRTLLIGRILAERGAAVAHIHADGGLESHEDAMNRLLDEFKLPHHGDLFRSREAVIADAVARQARRVGARWREAPSY